LIKANWLHGRDVLLTITGQPVPAALNPASPWCKMMQEGGIAMVKKLEDSIKSVRSTVSIPAEQHEALQRIADKKRVPFA